MKKNDVLIGAIAVIGALTLFNTYKVLTNDGGRIIPPATTNAQTTAVAGTGDNFPNANPGMNNNQFQQQNQPQPKPIQQGQPDLPKTKISFKEMKHDFGKVLSTSANEHTFTFTNTGTEPLVITNAKGSCGCTVPEWPKEPILPGETGKIDVVYKPNGQNGPNSKQVTVTANTDPINTILTISGDIQPDPNAPKPQAQPQMQVQPQAGQPEQGAIVMPQQ
ncbi:MAG: DUF1573 domain-containing protein [Flavobacteriales bacterium]